MGISSDAAEARMATSEVGPGSEQLVCSTCGGVGYYLVDVPIGHPNFGELMTCTCKQVYKDQRASEERRRLSNLNAFTDKTFKTFHPNVPGVERAYECALTYARQFSSSGIKGNRYPWLVLFGNCGCGKTHLAAAIANKALQNDYEVIFAIVPDLLDHLRSTFGPTSDVAYDERFETIREISLLVLDDLGTENTTPWAREKLYQIINHRYNYRLQTIITSNRRPEDIDQRIFSRLSDYTLHEGIIMIEAGDYRRLKPGERLGNRKR